MSLLCDPSDFLIPTLDWHCPINIFQFPKHWLLLHATIFSSFLSRPFTFPLITCTYCWWVTLVVTAAIPLCCCTMSDPSPVTMYCTPCLSCNIVIVIVIRVGNNQSNPASSAFSPKENHLSTRLSALTSSVCSFASPSYLITIIPFIIITNCSIPLTGPPSSSS